MVYCLFRCYSRHSRQSIDICLGGQTWEVQETLFCTGRTWIFFPILSLMVELYFVEHTSRQSGLTVLWCVTFIHCLDAIVACGEWCALFQDKIASRLNRRQHAHNALLWLALLVDVPDFLMKGGFILFRAYDRVCAFIHICTGDRHAFKLCVVGAGLSPFRRHGAAIKHGGFLFACMEGWVREGRRHNWSWNLSPTC